MTDQEFEKLMAEAREQARRNTEKNRDKLAAELEAFSKLSPREQMRKFAESF